MPPKKMTPKQEAYSKLAAKIIKRDQEKKAEKEKKEKGQQ